MSDDAKSQTLPPRFFESLAREAIMGIMAFRIDDHQCVYSNAIASEILEAVPQTEGAPLELKVEDLFPEITKKVHLRTLSDEVIQREGLTQDVLVQKNNGFTFIANVFVKYIQISDTERTLLLMFQDITFQKKLQRELTLKQEEIHKAFTELLEQNRQLKELDHAKDKFIALTSHELRTPLSAIVATAEVLQLKLYDTQEQAEDFIKAIYEQGLHLMELINDVLDFAKIRAGKMDFYIEQKDVRPVLEKLLENFQNMADQGNVTMTLDLPKEEAVCYFDLMRLKEIVNNVISNAIKYNRKDGTVHITVAPFESYLRVTVADTGQGIAPDKIQHVFNEFETVGNVARHHKGTGLGMPISKKLVENMGGRLSLESEVGVGTKFYIDLPIEKVLGEDMYRSRPDAWGDLAA